MIVRQAVGVLSLDDAPRNARLRGETKTKNDLIVRSATRARSGTVRSGIRVNVTLDPTLSRSRSGCSKKPA